MPLGESSYLSGCPAVNLPGQSKVMRTCPYLDGVRLFKSQSMRDVDKLKRDAKTNTKHRQQQLFKHWTSGQDIFAVPQGQFQVWSHVWV